MIMTISMIANRNALGDSYKNIVNAFKNKNNIICIVPGAYSIEEFSSEFRERIHEEVMNEQFKFLKAFFLLRKIDKLIQLYKIDKVFIYFDNSWFNLLIGLLLKFYKLEFIVWVHDPILHLGESMRVRIIRELNKNFFFQKVSRFVVSYDEAIYDLSDRYKIDRKKIISVKLPRMSEMEFSSLKIKENEILYDFIFFGRIEEYKGIDLLVDVIKDLRDIKLLIVGRGKMEHAIKEKIIGFDNIVFINDYLSNEKLAEKIIQSKWVVLPYKIATGSQTVQISNFYRKPVLATKVGCFKEYIIDGKNGFFIDSYCYESMYHAIIYAMNKDYLAYQNTIDVELRKFEINHIVKYLEEFIFHA